MDAGQCRYNTGPASPTPVQCYIDIGPVLYRQCPVFLYSPEWRAEARNGVRTATDDQFIEERAREHRTLHVPGPYTMVKLVSKGSSQYFTKIQPSDIELKL